MPAEGAAGVVDTDVRCLAAGIDGVAGDRVLVVLRCGRRPVGAVEVPVRDGRVDGNELFDAAMADPEFVAVATNLALQGWLTGRRHGPADASVASSWTAVVCTRDRPAPLERALAALCDERRRVGRGEILVVDNAPRDGATAEVARRFPVRYVVEREPGLNAARRRALDESTADIVLFTDDDAVVESGWVEAMLAPFADRRVAAVTGVTLPLELATPAQRLFERYMPLHRGFRGRSFDFTSTRPAAAGVVGAGVNFAVRRDTAERLAVFAAALDAGTPSRSGGDTYALYRILADGWSIVYTPDAVARHEHRRAMPDAARAIAGYSTGAYVVLLRALLHHHDLGAVKVGLQWFRDHHVRELARAVRRHPDAAPLGLVLAEWRAVFAAVGAYRRTEWA